MSKIKYFMFLILVVSYLPSKGVVEPEEGDSELYGLTLDNLTVSEESKKGSIVSYKNEEACLNYDYIAGEYKLCQEGELIYASFLTSDELGTWEGRFYIGDYGFYTSLAVPESACDCNSLVTDIRRYPYPNYSITISSSSSLFEEGGKRVFNDFWASFSDKSYHRDELGRDWAVTINGKGNLEVESKGDYWVVRGEIRFNFPMFDLRNRLLKYRPNDCYDPDELNYADLLDRTAHETTMIIKFSNMTYIKTSPRDLYLVNHIPSYYLYLERLIEQMPEEERVLYRARNALDKKGFLNNEAMEEKLKAEGKLRLDQNLGRNPF